MTNSFGMVFPGQGSQSIGMMAEIAQAFPKVERLFAEASAVLGYDLWALTQQGPSEQLNQTEYTQPALLAADVALWECWCDQGGPMPIMMAGHSLGEYASLVCAKALDFSLAIELVAARGHYMQAAVKNGEGAMAAIVGLDDQAVQTLCDEVAAGEAVSPANFNSIGQVVIAGQRAAVERAIDHAKEKGAKLAKLIPVSVPSHCALMQSAADKLAEKLKSATINVPKISVIHNVDVHAHQQPQEIKQALVDQLTRPVRWVDTINYMRASGIEAIVECGPGNVLIGLNKRIERQMNTYQINTVDGLKQAIAAFSPK